MYTHTGIPVNYQHYLAVEGSRHRDFLTVLHLLFLVIQCKSYQTNEGAVLEDPLEALCDE